MYQTKSFQKEPVLILGGGSNILFTKNFDGLVISNKIREKIIFQDSDYVHLRLEQEKTGMIL